MNIDFEKVSAELKIRPEILRKLIASFTLTLADRMVSLSDALEVNDAAKMRAILHEIKGTAGNLRLVSITEPESIMHAAVKDGADQEKLKKYFTALKASSDELQQFIEQQGK